MDDARAGSHDRWVVNKVRALASWYTKSLVGGSHLRTAINHAESIGQLREIVALFFISHADTTSSGLQLADPN